MKRPEIHGHATRNRLTPPQTVTPIRGVGGVSPRVQIGIQRVESDAARFTATRRRRRRRLFVGGGVIFALALIVTGVVMSPLMTLTTIVVTGRDNVAEKVITGAVSDQIGKPLALLDYDAIRNRLASVTRIQSFSTELQPPHTLVVRVVERQPVGYLVDGSKWSLVDAAGVIVDTVSVPPTSIPLFSVGSTTDLAFSAITDTLVALPESFRKKIGEVSAKTRDSVTLVMRGTPHRIIWGSPDKTPLKAVVAQRALTIVDNYGRAYEIDVSAPDNIVLRPL